MLLKYMFIADSKLALQLGINVTMVLVTFVQIQKILQHGLGKSYKEVKVTISQES